MTRVNQYGETIFEIHLGSHTYLKPDELQFILFEVLEHLKLEVVRTNATKHGDTQIVVRQGVYYD